VDVREIGIVGVGLDAGADEEAREKEGAEKGDGRAIVIFSHILFFICLKNL